MAEKKARETVTMPSVHASRIQDSKTNPNLAIIRTELPENLKENAQFDTGFTAVPKFAIHMNEKSQFASINLDASSPHQIQFKGKDGEYHTEKVDAKALVDAHVEANKEYRAQKAAEMGEKVAEAPEKSAEAQMGE